jgi:perosamine synthetase
MSQTKRIVQISLPATGEDEWQAAREPLLSGWLTQGPKVVAFERAFAEEHNAVHELAIINGATEMLLILTVLEVSPDEEPNTGPYQFRRARMSFPLATREPSTQDISRVTAARLRLV